MTQSQEKVEANRIFGMAEKWFQSLNDSLDPPVPSENETQTWKPKNLECNQLFEKARYEWLEQLRKNGRGINKKDWENPGPGFWSNPIVPHYEAPTEVITHVNTHMWEELTCRIGLERHPVWERRNQLAEMC